MTLKMKNNVISISTNALLLVIVSLTPIVITAAHAQQQTTTIIPAPEREGEEGAFFQATPDMQAILDDTAAECAQRGVPQCMTVDFASMNLLVLSGAYYLPSGAEFYPNPYLWKTVTLIQAAEGLSIDSIAVSSAPPATHIRDITIYVVMSR